MPLTVEDGLKGVDRDLIENEGSFTLEAARPNDGTGPITVRMQLLNYYAKTRDEKQSYAVTIALPPECYL